MEHGYLILGMLSLLFVCIYGYSYIPEILEERKLKRLKLEQAELEEIRRLRRIKNDEIRAEKLLKLNKRSEEIRLELKRLEQMKENRMNLSDAEVHRMKVDKMKKQQAG